MSEENNEVVVEEAPQEQMVDVGEISDADKLRQAVEQGTPEPEPEVQDPVQESKEFDPTKDRVDFDKPEQQEKFNHVYKQMKASDSRNQMLTDTLVEQQRQLDEALSQLKELNNRHNQNDVAQARQMLEQKLQHAREEGDDAARDSALLDLAKFDLKAEEREQEVEAEKPKAEPQYEYTDEQAGRDRDLLESFAYSRTDEGELSRPWLFPNHPLFEQATHMSHEIQKKYSQDDPDIVGKVLKDLDYHMVGLTEAAPKTSGNSRAPDPMGGSNLTSRPSQGKMKLSRAQMDVIEKLNRNSKVQIDPKKYWARTQGDKR